MLYTSGGASVPTALLRAFEARTGRTLFEGYGLSEGAPVSFNTHVPGSVPDRSGCRCPARRCASSTASRTGSTPPATKVYPREVEEVVHELDDVVEAAVAGAPDAYRGETVKLAVVVREGSSPTEDDIVAHCRQHLAAYEVPRIVEFREALPKGAVGKILRREI